MAVQKLPVEIYGESKKLFSGKCDSIIVPGAAGELGFLPGHTRLVSPLRKGTIRITDGMNEKQFEVNETGIVCVEKNGVRVILK